MTHHSFASIDCIFLGYEFWSFAREMIKNIAENISKSLSAINTTKLAIVLLIKLQSSQKLQDRIVQGQL